VIFDLDERSIAVCVHLYFCRQTPGSHWQLAAP
jgi:hypothetical protein